MEAATVGAPPNYRVESPSTKITEIVIAGDQIDRIADARKILIEATLSTDNDELVKIYSDYIIDLKLGAKVGIKF
jgi:hypothetical protein